jgi:hypothetical protein
MLDFVSTPTPNTSDDTNNAQTTNGALTTVHANLIRLLTQRAQTPERYASLLSRARTRAAQELVTRLCQEIEEHEQNIGETARAGA